MKEGQRGWMDNLKEGDPVILQSRVRGSVGRRYWQGTVSKMTPTQCHVDAGNSAVIRYRRDNGREVGDSRRGVWDSGGPFAYPATEENLKALQVATAEAVIRTRRQALVSGIDRSVVEALSERELFEITSMLNAARARMVAKNPI